MKKVSDGYQSYDGNLFNSQEECIHHERLELGIRKICRNCSTHAVNNDCKLCGGNGWTEEKELWN